MKNAEHVGVIGRLPRLLCLIVRKAKDDARVSCRVMPMSCAAAAWVSFRWRIVPSIRTTSPALIRCWPASARPRSANTLPVLGSRLRASLFTWPVSPSHLVPGLGHRANGKPCAPSRGSLRDSPCYHRNRRGIEFRGAMRTYGPGRAAPRRFSLIIMVSSLEEVNGIIRDTVHQAVFLADTTRPAAYQHVS